MGLVREQGCPLCDGVRRYMYQWNGFALYRCGTCGTESVDPMPDAEELGVFYQAISAKKMSGWERRLERVKAAFDGYIDRYRELAGAGKPTRFLDVGGGVGYYARAALDLGIDACLVDWASDALLFTQRTLGVAKVVRADVQRCGDIFAPGSFDFVLARHTIEHMLDPGLFLRQIAAALRPGGVLQVETPNVESREQFRHPGVMLESYRLIRSANPKMRVSTAAARTLAKSVSGVNPPKHLWGFTPTGLTMLLRCHEFEVARVERAVAGHSIFDPLYFDLQGERPRTVFSGAHDLWRRAATPLFAGRGMNLAITALQKP